MLSLAFSLAGLLLVVAGFCIIIGATALGKRLILIAIGGWAVLALVASLLGACPGFGSGLGLLLGAVLLLVLVALLARHHFLASVLWWCVKQTISASYHVGLWLAERLLHFPIMLLPALARGVIKLACVFLVPSLVAFAALLASRGNTSALVYFIIAAPLLVVLLAGLIGKWSYRKQERKGLANV